MSDAAPSALLDLVRFLRHSQDTLGLVKIPTAIENAVKRDLLPQSIMSIGCVEAIVGVLDHQEPSLCSRLDLHAFIIVYLILSKAEDCAAQQRGLALLTESLQNIVSPLQDPSLGLEKKIRLGQKALNFLIQHFANQRRMDLTRRWMGVFALELLSGCDENKTLLLKKAQDTWRSIGDNILHGTCEILKLVAGLLIGELWPHGPPTDAPWFSERDSAIYASFPNYISRSSQWIVDFESFVDVLDSEGFLSETRIGVFLAYGVSVGAELTYGWEDQSAILVTVSPELNIVVCASETSPARYIDILHDQIESVSLEKRQRISQTNTVVQEDLVILVVWLTKSSDTTLYVGAGKRFASSISIAFTSLDEAAAITKRLLERAPHIVEKFTCSESEPLSLSQPMVETIEEQGVLFNADSHIDTIRPAIVTSATDSVSLPAFIRTPKPDLIHSFLNWPKNVSASLLQTADLSDLRSNTGISIEDIQIESILSRSHSPTKNLEDRSGGSRRDSAEWRKGAILIDFDPELQDATNHVLKEGGLLGINSSPVQLKLSKRDSDRDSFYDATPRVQNAILEHADQVRTHSQGCQGLKKSLEVSLMPITTPQVMDKSCKAENSRNTGGGAAKLVVQAPEKEEFINGNAGDVHNLGAVRKKYTSKRKLLPTNASQKIAFGKNCTDRKANSLSVKIGCFQRHERGENEFDFPLSPQKTRTPKNAWRPVLKKLLSKEGAISPAPEKKTLNNRSLPPEKGDPLVPDVVVRNKHQGVLPSMASFRQRNSKSFNDESTGVKWDEGLVVDGKPSGADPDPPRKGSRGKAKWVTKRSKNKDNEAYSSKQGSEETMRKTNKKTRSAPRPAPRPRNRRAAALIADQRIKNTIDCNTSQEQGRGELVHEVETARPKSSQEASSPSILAGSNLNFDHGVSQQANAQHLFTLIENRNLNHDEMPEIASGSELRPRDGDCEIIANANATELAGNPKRRPVVIFGNSTLQCVPVNDMNGMTHINDGDGRAKEGQLSGHTSSMASPRSGVFLRGDNGAIPFREPIIENNGAEGLLISRSRSESPSLSHLHILDTARETCSSDKLVSALALPDSSDKLVSAFALSDSQRNSHVGPAFQREDAFALSLRKALSNVPLSNEHHHHTLEAQLDPSGPALYSRAALRNQTCRVRQNSKRPRMSRQPFVYETPVAQTAPPLTPLHSYHRVAGDDRSLKRASRGSETDPVHEKRPRTSSSSITDVTDRPSSRGTRVTPDGSPMKSVISPADSLKLNEEYECTLLEQRLSMKVNAKDPFGLIDKSDPGPVISPLHLRRRKAEMRSWRRSSGKNSKHRKSLDGSKSSGASQLTAHRIHPNGGFINIHTEAAVVPIEPANPFLETRKAYAKKAENDDFMRILRESCNLSDNQNICLGLNGLEESHDSTDPPSTECSSSDRSSRKRRVSSASTTDEEESLHEEAVERRDLTSHQKTQIDALFKVSRGIVVELIKQEKKIDEAVSAHKRGGKRIMRQFKKARKQDIRGLRKDSIEYKKQMITKLREEYARVQTQLDRLSESTHVRDQEADWSMVRRGMLARTERALATRVV